MPLSRSVVSLRLNSAATRGRDFGVIDGNSLELPHYASAVKHDGTPVAVGGCE